MAKEPDDERGPGQPPKIETVEQYESLIEDYFTQCVPKPMFVDDANGETVMVKDSRGNPVVIDNPPTIAGLALRLGFVSRQSIYDQDDRGEAFSYARKKAVLRIMAHHEARLSGPSPVGSIFWTKNHGWSDKQEVEVTDLSGAMTYEEKQKRINEILAARNQSS